MNIEERAAKAFGGLWEVRTKSKIRGNKRILFTRMPERLPGGIRVHVRYFRRAGEGWEEIPVDPIREVYNPPNRTANGKENPVGAILEALFQQLEEHPA